jgi:FKBP-type peptidyl-prolyl cis-trans isomerase FklB
MRFSFWSVVGLAVTAAVAIGAQPPQKKQAAPATPSKDENAEAQAQASDEKPATETDEKSSKNNSKKPAGTKLTLSDEVELLKTLSYIQGFAQGHQMFLQFKEQGIALDEEALVKAFKDGLAGNQPEMTEDEIKQVLPQIQKYMDRKFSEKARERAVVTKQEGLDFLTENKKKEGVKTLQSGLQYKVLKSGKGETPKKTDTVKVHYKGNLLNGTEFDSSHKRGAPATMQVSRVIPGWTEALQLMKVGDKWELFVPSNLAYGEAGFVDQQQRREIIPPNATLIFEVELISIEKGGKPSSSATTK